MVSCDHVVKVLCLLHNNLLLTNIVLDEHPHPAYGVLRGQKLKHTHTHTLKLKQINQQHKTFKLTA